MDFVKILGFLLAVFGMFVATVLFIIARRRLNKERKRHRAEWAKDLIRHNIAWEEIRKRYGMK